MPRVVRNRHAKRAQTQAVKHWHDDWKERLESIVRHGLPVKILDVDIAADHYGFISMRLEASEDILPRTHKMRNFQLHLSIAFRSDFRDGIAEEAVQRLRARWAGEWTILRIRRNTSGGTVELAADELIVMDDDVVWLHSRGYYRKRPLHVSL